MFGNRYLLFFLLIICHNTLYAQKAISLKEAVELGVENYGTVKAKNNYAKASKALVEQAKRDYAPNLNIGAQQDYGTVNGQNGPLYGFGGLGVSSSGLPLPQQNWNAAFGALYLANVNWDFFAFGRARDKILTAKAVATRDSKDWQQEIFKHKIRVAAAYLNLIAAQQLARSYQKNLERADTFRRIIVTRAMNGLVAGVDSSQANAESSNAKIALTKAMDYQQEQATQLAQLLAVPLQDFKLDTFFVSRIPEMPVSIPSLQDHPALQWYMSRLEVSKEQTKYYRTFYYPAFSLVGVYQTRASGFGSGYATNQNDFNHEYWSGINPTRANYLLGVGVTWNLTQPFRMSQQVKAQKFISKGLQDEYNLTEQQIETQLSLSEAKIKFAMSNYREAAVQVKAASDAYTQKSVLYKNGLTNLVDLTQSLYALVRAETDRDIAYSNVWQALLLKAAAAGDFNIFEDQL